MLERIFYRQSIAVKTMVFNDQEKLDNEDAGQTLPSHKSVDETDE